MSDFTSKYGPYALVTGASSGIGAQFANDLEKFGFNLVLVARRKEILDAMASNLTAAQKIDVRVIALDLADPVSIPELIRQTDDLEIGLLVNNAGFALTGSFLDHEIEDEAALFQVNNTVPILLSHAYGRKMKDRGKGGIINVASAVAFFPMPFWTSYAASKSCLLSFSMGLHGELQSKGVDVLALCPGATETEFAKRAGISFSGMKVETVVSTALSSLGRKPVVVVGAVNWLLTTMMKWLPLSWTASMGKMAVKSMTR